MKNVAVVQKEQLNTVRFQKIDVLADSPARLTRLSNLNRALSLGNLFRGKVNIIFMTSSGLLQQVETTVWSMSEDFILLKGGNFIPVKAILELEF